LSRNGLPSEIYEDGRILRDLVYIDDVVDALFATVQQPATGSRCLDIGSGPAITIHELARKIAATFDAPEPIVVPKFRDGDIRAASCNIDAAKKAIQWRPTRTIDDGLHSLLDWIGQQSDSSFEATDHPHASGQAVERAGRR